MNAPSQPTADGAGREAGVAPVHGRRAPVTWVDAVHGGLPRSARTGTAAAVIGLDLGGTKIAAALFDADGTVLARHTRPTPALNGAAAVLDALAEAAAAVDPGRLATALGIAAAGVVDPRTGMVTSATDSILGWAGTALGTGLADRTGLPVACDNDVRATAGPELAALRAPKTDRGSAKAAGQGRAAPSTHGPAPSVPSAHGPASSTPRPSTHGEAGRHPFRPPSP